MGGISHFLMENDPSSPVDFPHSTEDFCQTNGVPFRTDRSTLLMVRLRQVQFFRKNKRPFVLKHFEREQLSLGLAALGRPTRLTLVYFQAHTRRSMIRHL